MMRHATIIGSLTVLVLLMAAPAVRAADFDGLPRFMEIDFDKKEISEVGDAQDERRTAIQNVTQGEGVLILQGAQNGRGWSLTITEANGDAVATIADPVSGFVLFGACTPR